MIVKASALSGDKNPNGELGLFEYVDSHNDAKTFLHEHIIRFSSIYREDLKNKRKSYHAMTFAQGRKFDEEQTQKVIDMVKEVHEKTSACWNVEIITPDGAACHYEEFEQLKERVGIDLGA